MKRFALTLISLVALPLMMLSCEKAEKDNTLPPPPPDDEKVDPPTPGPNPPTPTPEPEGGYIIVGYAYADSGALPDPKLLTHINFSFAKINDDFETLYIRSSKQKRLKQIVGLKAQKPSLKVMLSVGGWGAGNFSEMAADETHRKNFCKNCLALVEEYGLDGIDLDWEYPTSNSAGISSSPNDTRNFTLLLKDLREVLGPDKLITMASEASAHYIDWGSALEYLDFVNIMSYDMGRPPYHNAALYPSSKTKMSCDEAVAKHYAKGVPYDKMTLGMAFFGRVDRNILTGDEMDYKDIVKLQGYTRVWDEQAMVPYLNDPSGTMVLSYDDETSIGLKADYVKEKGLKGAMYWDIEADDASWTLGKAVADRLLPSEEPITEDAFLATNEYIEKFLTEVDYGDSDYTYSSIIGYPGGGPSDNNEEIPPTYTVSWTASSGSQLLKVWENDWSREYELASGVGKQDITNLVPNTTYHWQVTSTADHSVVAKGEFATRGHLHQVYYTPNVRNGRDLGGYKGLDGKTVVYHKLYRGGRIDKKYCDENGRKEMLAEGILAEVDLREESDVPSKSPLGSDIAFFAPGFDSGYNTMVRDNPAKVKDTFCWVVARLRENKPVYFHCAAGRDRTATLAVLLEGALGVSESDMAKDYELTYFTPTDWGMSKDDSGNYVYKHVRTSYSYTSLKKTITTGRTGTYQECIARYLLDIGVPQQDLDDLRAIMLH